MTEAKTSNLKDLVRKDLEKHGYPFELRVAQHFTKHGWSVEYARWYRDPETSKLRECDLIASLSLEEPREGMCTFEFIIECKHSPGKPWVVFASPLSDRKFSLASTFTVGLLSDSSLFALGQLQSAAVDFIKPRAWVAHGITKVFSTNGGDPTSPYAALRSVISAATAIAEENDRFSANFTNFEWPRVSVPLLIIDAPLFRYSLDNNGLDHLEQISSAYILSSHIASPDRLAVRLLTWEALSREIFSLTQAGQYLLERISEHRSLAMKVFRQRSDLERRRGDRVIT